MCKRLLDSAALSSPATVGWSGMTERHPDVSLRIKHVNTSVLIRLHAILSNIEFWAATRPLF